MKKLNNRNIKHPKNQKTDEIGRFDLLVSQIFRNVLEAFLILQTFNKVFILTIDLLDKFNEFRDTEPGEPGKLNRNGLGETAAGKTWRAQYCWSKASIVKFIFETRRYVLESTSAFFILNLANGFNKLLVKEISYANSKGRCNGNG